MTQHHWFELANCANLDDPDVMHVRGAEQHLATRICDGCVVVAPCLAEALDNPEMTGVWGGMTDRERRALLKKRPNVKSWANLLRAAEAAHNAEVVAQVVAAAEHDEVNETD